VFSATTKVTEHHPRQRKRKTNREERMGLRIWGGLLLVAAALAMNGGARAQTYPDRPVRILIAFPAGGTIDTLGRILAQKLGEAWGQNVVIENRPGGGGNIGAGGRGDVRA
jgi:tripartite-type tricarboxylate transporter receptor subunit TctC